MGLENYELGAIFFASPPSTFFHATNVILGNDVMVRRLTVDPARAQDVHETFFREQRLSATLRHPHIQRPIDVFEADGYLWSVHELQTLRSTFDIVREDGPMLLADAARLGGQVADALAHMHASGHVHGKMSPHCVTVDERGDGLVINLVKAADLHAGVWPLRPVVIGLSPFTAPEEFRGARPTPASDVYGLAATIFFWITGQWPRGGRDEEEALARARDGAALECARNFCQTVSAGLAERLEGALHPDPAQRHGSAAALGSLLVELHQRHAAEIPSGFQTGARLHPQGDTTSIEVLGRHGAGAFGVVLRARSDADDAVLAVKALKPEHRDDQHAYERFVREARALQQIQHPNVVGIRGVGEENGTPYAVMDFIAGPDLGTVILREGALPPERVARLAAGIARGLEAIHAEGIVHRDLKPHNILVGEGERPIIADFGVARQDKTTRLTMTGQLAGTPMYMAPEQFDGREITYGVDLYALGTLTYEMLTGTPPFSGTDTLSAITAIRDTQPPPLPEEVPAGLRALTLALLEKDPALRPGDAGAVARALEALAGSIPAPA